MFDLFCTYVIKTNCLVILKGVDSRLEFQVVKVPRRFCVNLWPRIPFVAFLVCRFAIQEKLVGNLICSNIRMGVDFLGSLLIFLMVDQALFTVVRHINTLNEILPRLPPFL